MDNQPAWRSDPPTDKQLTAISNMYTALGWSIESPNTKGEASDMIGKAHKEIQNRVSSMGRISYPSIGDNYPGEWDYENDYLGMNEF